MATVLHKTTKQLIESANTADYINDANWIINPDMSAVEGYGSQYWLIDQQTGAVTLMDQAARDAVDLAAINSARDATAARVDYIEDIIRALSLTLLDELNMHAERTNAILTAIDSGTTMAEIKASVSVIADVPIRTINQLKNALRSKLGT